jgi:hypothetical protein
MLTNLSHLAIILDTTPPVDMGCAHGETTA